MYLPEYCMFRGVMGTDIFLVGPERHKRVLTLAVIRVD